MNDVTPLVSVSPSPGKSVLRPHRELLVAWVLVLLDREKAYGYKVHEQLRARGVHLDPASLYRVLRNFEREGWAKSRWTAPITGPRRRLYVLTAHGRRVLHEFSALIAATGASYSAFVRAHEHGVAQRVNRPAALDEHTLPAEDVQTSTERRAPGDQAPAPGPPTLRPHKELLAGWLLLRLDAGPTYGYELRRDFVAHGLRADPAGVYRMLRRLEADAWLQSRWLSSSAGPRRRYYRLTTAGRLNLDETAELIAAMRDLHDDYLREYALTHPLAASDGSAAA